MTVRGDEADLFGAYNATLVSRLAGHLGGERDMTEEAAAFAWLQLLRHQPDRGRVRGGLVTVAKHEAYAILRRRGRAQHTLELDAQPARAGAGPLERLERRELLRLVERLSARQRLALGLFMRGYSYREICAATGQSYTWVSTATSTKAAARLRELTADDDRLSPAGEHGALCP